MKKLLFFLLGLVFGIGIVWGFAILMQSKTEIEKVSEQAQNIPSANQNISIVKPLANEEISTPVLIEGKAKGTWFFEGVSFVKVVDEQGVELGSGDLKARGNWMTEDFVPLNGEIFFDKSSSKTGFLIFEKNNPSGLKENSKEFKLPVKFK